MQLTIFYDSMCPLCAREMAQLRHDDEHGRLVFADIHAQGFAARYPHIDPGAADRKLHAQYDDGKMIYGLDVTHQAWALVGRHKWIGILRWPVLRWFADIAYVLFARYRYGISYLLTGQRRCAQCVINTESRSAGDRS